MSEKQPITFSPVEQVRQLCKWTDLQFKHAEQAIAWLLIGGIIPYLMPAVLGLINYFSFSPNSVSADMINGVGTALALGSRLAGGILFINYFLQGLKATGKKQALLDVASLNNSISPTDTADTSDKNQIKKVA